ncbi:MAG TPA: hypothetical protein VMS09_04195 [Paenibacillus sp.]|uniref:hypothetical protein n=1 Tax=Paenibacillus sp. TaxID=58172 RepID=UPI0028D3C83A|nr:hypothetical protein [Paenibacillus sp.]HUC91215.1 hypothetical protein [Paenibacillus sp.]
MAFNPSIVDIEAFDKNEKTGLYQFVATLPDQSKVRLFMSKNPKWKLEDVNRLLNNPCPICRKDYYCKCMERHMSSLEASAIEKINGQ